MGIGWLQLKALNPRAHLHARAHAHPDACTGARTHTQTKTVSSRCFSLFLTVTSDNESTALYRVMTLLFNTHTQSEAVTQTDVPPFVSIVLGVKAKGGKERRGVRLAGGQALSFGSAE